MHGAHIGGDCNIQVDVQDNPNVESFLDLIDSLGLVQHVHFATHVQGHTPDLVITRKWTASFKTHRF